MSNFAANVELKPEEVIFDKLMEVVVPGGRMGLGDLANRKRTGPGSMEFELDDGEMITLTYEDRFVFEHDGHEAVVAPIDFDLKKGQYVMPGKQTVVQHLLSCYLQARGKFASWIAGADAGAHVKRRYHVGEWVETGYSPALQDGYTWFVDLLVERKDPSTKANLDDVASTLGGMEGDDELDEFGQHTDRPYHIDWLFKSEAAAEEFALMAQDIPGVKADSINEI